MSFGFAASVLCSVECSAASGQIRIVVFGAAPGGGRRRIQFPIVDAEDHFRTDPGAPLDGTGFLMGEIPPVGGEAAAEISVPDIGFRHPVFRDAPEMREHGGRVGHGGGAGDGAGDIVHAVVDHALLDVHGIGMGGGVEGLDDPVVVGDVHDDGPRGAGAGAGGQALGLAMAGFFHIALVEYEKEYCDTLLRNRPEWNVICADIKDFSGAEYRGKVDLLAGGSTLPSVFCGWQTTRK